MSDIAQEYNEVCKENAELRAALQKAERKRGQLAADVAALREALNKLWKHTPKISNGYCAVCRTGYRWFETDGTIKNLCSNERCLSHVVESALDSPNPGERYRADIEHRLAYALIPMLERELDMDPCPAIKASNDLAKRAVRALEAKP